MQIKRTGDDGAIPELHLLPDGEFKPQAAEDAREMPKSGTYRMNAQIAEKVIALARASVNDLPIDYEHQTQQAATNGQPAPAAGWMAGAKFVFRPGEGLFAQGVQWTARAKQMLDDDEYRYQSATFLYHPETGDVLAIVGAALTNRPALDGLTSAQLAALSAQFAHQFLPHIRGRHEPSAQSPARRPRPARDRHYRTRRIRPGRTEVPSRAGWPDRWPERPDRDAQVDAARSDQVRVGGSRCFLEHRTGDLRAQTVQGELDQIMDQAKAEGKVASDVVEKTWRDIGKADLAQLKALVAATPANPVLAGKRQTDGKQPGQDAGELNQAELAVCAAMGMTPEQFKAGKQAQGLANG